MTEFFEVVLDSLIDTAKILPILLIVYFLIEFLEYKKVMKLENSKMMNGKFSPVFGSLFGCIPQCGFSVISTDLYSKKAISVGALIAVFISTSDEAIPIMLSHPKSIPSMFAIVGVKLVLGIALGYFAIFMYSIVFKNKRKIVVEAVSTDEVCVKGCCSHHMESKKFDWFHPLVHCFKISLYIFIVNLIMGTIIMFVGVENFETFLASSYAFQPLFAVIIGFIPNCASSVLLTELYVLGQISFGSIIAGLMVNAGIGLVVLYKQNKDWKENLFITLMLIIPSIAVGYALHFINIF